MRRVGSSRDTSRREKGAARGATLPSEFVVYPRIAGHGPTPFAGLSQHVELTLVDRVELGSGTVALRYSLVG